MVDQLASRDRGFDPQRPSSTKQFLNSSLASFSSSGSDPVSFVYVNISQLIYKPNYYKIISILHFSALFLYGSFNEIIRCFVYTNMVKCYYKMCFKLPFTINNEYWNYISKRGINEHISLFKRYTTNRLSYDQHFVKLVGFVNFKITSHTCLQAQGQW